MARRGAKSLGEPGEAIDAWRAAIRRARGEALEPRPGDDEPWAPEVFVEADEYGADESGYGTGELEADRYTAVDVSAEPSARRRARRDAAAPAPGRARRRRDEALPPEVSDEVGRSAGPRAGKSVQRLAEATRAYERDRYQEARRLLKPLAQSMAGVASVRELYGLTLYRLGSWAAALAELEAFHALSGSYDQHPVMADCNRALGRLDAVRALWDDLRRAGVGAEVLAEGRIVLAGALADSGNLEEAVATLEAARLDVKHPQPHHLRLWFALADLYERAGEIPRARSLFERVARHDPDLYDVHTRLAGLGRPIGRRAR